MSRVIFHFRPAILALALLPRACPSLYVPLTPRAVDALHSAANRATKQRKHADAQVLLEAAANHGENG